MYINTDITIEEITLALSEKPHFYSEQDILNYEILKKVPTPTFEKINTLSIKYGTQGKFQERGKLP